MPTIWFTLLAADNHWLDLNKIIYGDHQILVFANKVLKAKWKCKLVYNNQYIIDSYFFDRFNTFINLFFTMNRLEVYYY